MSRFKHNWHYFRLCPLHKIQSKYNDIRKKQQMARNDFNNMASFTNSSPYVAHRTTSSTNKQLNNHKFKF